VACEIESLLKTRVPGSAPEGWGGSLDQLVKGGRKYNGRLTVGGYREKKRNKVGWSEKTKGVTGIEGSHEGPEGA